MVSNVDVPLSDLIKNKKKTHKKPIGKGIPKRRSSSGIQKRRSSGAAVPRRQSAGAGRRSNQSTSDRVVIVGDNKRNVRVNIANLAYSVVSSDLKELFSEFHLKHVSVNFNENGQPLGTADITLSKQNADRLVQKFAGVSLDGRTMRFSVIDTSNIASRVDFRGRKSIETPKQTQKNGKVAQKKKVIVKKQQQKKKKPATKEKTAPPTAEQLDAELDAYMAGGRTTTTEAMDV